ncbi:hypothetical protein [Lacticaseibacillus daqingensis]|uniref:hypothetical protein n=1 Tax=Lacticaseibacillus daqingensis TaxID=2486014 RepID=UPI000F79979A|nr:hypothetical protein [Lacticaseibacillus daqingensis]
MRRFTLTGMLVVGVLAAAVGLWALWQQPVPNVFGVGALGVLMGAGLALLIVTWWPHQSN